MADASPRLLPPGSADTRELRPGFTSVRDVVTGEDRRRLRIALTFFAAECGSVSARHVDLGVHGLQQNLQPRLIVGRAQMLRNPAHITGLGHDLHLLWPPTRS